MYFGLDRMLFRPPCLINASEMRFWRHVAIDGTHAIFFQASPTPLTFRLRTAFLKFNDCSAVALRSLRPQPPEKGGEIPFCFGRRHPLAETEVDPAVFIGAAHDQEFRALDCFPIAHWLAAVEVAGLELGKSIVLDKPSP